MPNQEAHIDWRPNEQEYLLSPHDEMNEMANLSQDSRRSRPETGYTEEVGPEGTFGTEPARSPFIEANGSRQVVYKVYKRRWFGLLQLVLLNIVVSWDWLSFSPVSNTAATFFSTTPTIINWLSTAFLFAFVAASPPTLYALHAGGPRLAILASSLFILLGNWLRCAGTRCVPPSYSLTMTGQILIGLAQPFVLAAPTHYSDLWFSPAGRVSATALASLANPFGGALGQLINPFLAPHPGDIPKMTLYVAIISSLATIPSIFLPARPPTPPSPASTIHSRPSLRKTILLLATSKPFYLLLLPFATYVGLFNSLSSLLTQILTPYNFSESASGIAGALLILVGLLAAAISSPLVDRSKAYLPFIKVLVPVIAFAYLAFIWAPQSRVAVSSYVILSVLGAASFSLVPVALEYLVEVTFPAGPEAGSTICWSAGQLLGGIFIVVSDALKAGKGADPPFHMRRALVFQAVVAMTVAPAAMTLGWIGGGVRTGRLEADKRGREREGEGGPGSGS